MTRRNELRLVPEFMRGSGCGFSPQGLPRFISPREIVYIVGRHLIIEDITTTKQTRFITLPHAQASHFAISFDDGLVVAVSFSNTPCIALLNLEDPSEYFEIIQTGKNIKGMAFSCDGLDLAFVTLHSKGKHRVSIWDVQEKKILKSECILSHDTDAQSNVNVIAANLFDPHSYTLAGRGFLRKISYCEKSRYWEQNDFEFPRHVSVISVTWVDYWITLLGCNDGLLRVADHDKIKATYRPREIETLDIMANEDPTRSEQEKDGVVLGGEYHHQYELKKRSPCITGILGNSVSSIAVYNGGLAYVCLPNHVVIMQETTKTNYSRVHTIELDIDNMSDVHDIIHITVCTQPKTTPPVLICTTKQGQNYVVTKGRDPEDVSLKYLSPRVHAGPITGLSLSWFKNRLASVSHDRQLLLWNLATGQVEYSERFDVGITGVTIDQTGFYVYVGFEYFIKFYMLRYNGLKEKMSLDIRPSSALQFSNTGAFVAVVNECNVMVFDNMYFESLHVLTGNTSTIKRLAWSYRDDYLASCSQDGVLWTWHMQSRERRRHLDLEDVRFQDIAMLKTRDVLCAVGNSPYIFTVDLHTTRTSRILAWSSLSYLSCISIATDDLFLFVGGDEGNLVSVWSPLEEDEDKQVRQIHTTYTTDITEILISPGKEYLITGSSRGTITQWFIYGEGLSTPKRIKTRIPVHLIVKEDYLEFGIKYERMLRSLDHLPLRLKDMLNKEARDLSAIFNEEKRPLNQDIKVLRTQLMPLLDICNDLLYQKKIIRDKLDARRKEFAEILKFKEEMNEFWQEVLHVSGFTLFLDECERDKKQYTLDGKNLQAQQQKTHETNVTTMNDFMSSTRNMLSVIKSHTPSFKRAVRRYGAQVDKVEEHFKCKHKTLVSKIERLRVELDTAPCYARGEIGVTWTQIERLKDELDTLYAEKRLDEWRSKEVVPKYESLLQQWDYPSLITGALEFELVDCGWIARELFRHHKVKKFEYEGALSLREHLILEGTLESEELEFETVPYLFREAEVNIVNFHRFLRDKGIELDDPTELRVVETKMLAAIRDLYAAAIAKEDAERRVIIKKYVRKNLGSFTDETLNIGGDVPKRKRKVDARLCHDITVQSMKIKNAFLDWQKEKAAKEAEAIQNEEEEIERLHLQTIPKTYLEKDIARRRYRTNESSEKWASMVIPMFERWMRGEENKELQEIRSQNDTLLKREVKKVIRKRPSEEPVLMGFETERADKIFAKYEKDRVRVKNETRTLEKAANMMILRLEGYLKRAGFFCTEYGLVDLSLFLDSEENIRRKYAPAIRRLETDAKGLETQIKDAKRTLMLEKKEEKLARVKCTQKQEMTGRKL